MAMQESVILDIQTWIDKNIDKPLRINDVAHRAGYSKWHLQRLFHEITAVPLGVYIRNKRLESAAYDLATTTTAIITISTRYGFDSQQTFTRLFSKRYSMPPGAWRRHHQSLPALD